MTAQATASLTIKVNVLGGEQLKTLSDQLKLLAQTAQRSAGAGFGRLAEGLAKTGAGATSARGQLRTLEQELARLQAKTDQERITRKAREILGGPPGTPGIVGKLRTVESEMARLERLTANRAITAQARDALGMSPSMLTGHGFLHKGRQTLGLMRDLAVAGMGVRYTFHAAAAGVGAIVGPVTEFQKRLAEVQTKGGFNASQMAEIAATTKRIGRTSQFGARDSASAAVELAASGLDPGAISKQLPNVMEFALAGGLDTSQSAMTLVETMSQFGLGSDQFTRIGDILVKAANMSTISVSDMSESLKYVGPIAATAGISLEQMSAMIALLGERGIKGSMAGTSLRQMIVSLTHPAKQAKEAMASIGLTKADMQKGLEDLPKFLVELDAKMAGKGMSQAARLSVTKRLFGSEALATVEALMRTMTERTKDGTTAWDKYRDGVAGANGDMSRTAKVMGDTLDGKIKKLKASVESAQIALGEGLAPTLTKLIPKLAAGAVSFGEWVGRNEDFVATTATVIPSMIGMNYAASTLIATFSGLAKMSQALGIASWGVSAGSAFATSFIGAALPVIAAGIAGYGIGTLIAKAIGGEEVGKAIFEAMNPGQAYMSRGERGLSPEQKFAKEQREKRAAFERDMNDPILQNLRRDEVEDPIMRGLRGDAPAAVARNTWNGLLKIEIDQKGQARVAGMSTNGPELEVGTNVGP